mmetsp:Transcript_6497/g.23098  ORF Transcript_6497/g.23098 Transcript_6497/m.23098 type:complete len:92 (+) Transcript_6497:2241-2516(+)
MRKLSISMWLYAATLWSGVCPEASSRRALFLSTLTRPFTASRFPVLHAFSMSHSGMIVAHDRALRYRIISACRCVDANLDLALSSSSHGLF